MNTYIPYHVHTEYSLLDSCTKAQEYIDLAVENGMKAISFSEHGKNLNWCEKWGVCKKAGIRYIHSVEIYLTESLEEKVRDNYHTVLMARNDEGLRELNRLISKSCNPDHFYYVNRISFDEFLNISDNIISTSACLASPLNKLPTDHPRYRELAKKYTFLEVQPHNHPDQIAFNKRLWELSKDIGTPLIAGTDTHSSTKYKAECRQILLKAKHKSYGDEDAFDLTFKTYDELSSMFKEQGALPEDVYKTSISNTNLLYNMTEDIELDTSIKYPILYGTREADDEKFTETVEEKFQEKLDTGIIPACQKDAFRAAIEEEMRVFRKLKMTGFMLSMSELICWCKKQGMTIGTARGSVGGSRVAYVTDIIDLNPETWHTIFSRFANEDREEIGDIDIDCVESDRPIIFKHIIDRFGADKTARVAAFGSIQSKSVIDEVGRALAGKWEEQHPDMDKSNNPWSLQNVARIKNEFDEDQEKAKEEYKELFYYYDGLIDTKISQSVHPAGMVISPITLPDNFGVFDKEGEICLVLDMDNIHEYTGLAKYDFLLLQTLQIISDTCKYLNQPYPKTNEIDWNDQNVWEDMTRSPCAIFQFSGSYAHECLKKFKPKNIFDMSIVAACIRPSGASYRNDLLARKVHHNPSKIIDDLLKDNLGYLIYQEDTIRFLQDVCGLSGSEADNIRRAIGRKQKDRLDTAMPSILEGYCRKSDKPREEAEQEAKEFLQVIEDSASYQFGYNHSIAYCLLGYLCAYYRYYHPIEFITAFLNNAANEDDIKEGTAYAAQMHIRVTMPKYGISKGEYFFDKEQGIIAKGLSSIKYISSRISDELFEIAHNREHKRFMDLLLDLDKNSSINRRQIEILIRIDFFSAFGNQRELIRLEDLFYSLFKRGAVSKIKKSAVAGVAFEDIIKKYSSDTTKSGTPAKNYTVIDISSMLRETEDVIKSLHIEDFSAVEKARIFKEAIGYAGYVSGKEEDRRFLYVLDVYDLVRKKDGEQFGYSVVTRSIGSGIESRFTVLNSLYEKSPIKPDDIICCNGYRESYANHHIYYQMTAYRKCV